MANLNPGNNHQKLVSWSKWVIGPKKMRSMKKSKFEKVSRRKIRPKGKSDFRKVNRWKMWPMEKSGFAKFSQENISCFSISVRGENFIATFTTLSVVIWFSTGTLGILATLVYVFTMRVVINDVLSKAIIPTLSTSILFCNLCYIL